MCGQRVDGVLGYLGPLLYSTKRCGRDRNSFLGLYFMGARADVNKKLVIIKEIVN